jgi:DNA-directed RNA polymerase alpha subunit
MAACPPSVRALYQPGLAERIQSIETLDLSVRTHNCLTRRASKPIRTIGQLVHCSEAVLSAIPKSGLTVVEEIRAKLAQYGLRLKGER